MTNAPYTIDMQNVEEQIAYGSGYITIPVQVAGFWSSSICELRIKRDWNWRNESEVNWTFDPSHSSGGREDEKKSGLTPLAAERNFALAVLALVALAEQLQARIPEMEAAYQRRYAAEKAAAEAERAAQAAAVAADPAIGEVAAKATVKHLIDRARKSEIRCHLLRAKLRGQDDHDELLAIRMWSDRIVLRWNGSPISVVKAAEQLAERARADLQVDLPLNDELQREFHNRYL